MNASTRIGFVTAAVTTLIGAGQLVPAAATAELHNVTYIARIDGVAPAARPPS
ncbi:hypothetical protein I552_6042 [Mycobacterium xenopi 3993]|nr:hypothetical protein I552_6042 [Mycobacterium xenopi 3993]